MKVHYFFRQFHQHQTSIEKLFNIIILAVKKNNITTKKIENKYGFSIKGIVSTLLFFRKNQGDINHITGDIHWAALALDSKKTVLTIHDLVGLHSLSGLKKKLFFYFWVYLPIKKLKYITVISEKTKNEIIAVIPEAESKIKVIPNALTTDIVPVVLDKKNDIPNILIVGTRSNKNIERTFNALHDLDIFLTIIGPLSVDQKNLLATYKINFSNVSNISDEELNELYDGADILCFPSLYEGFGLPILEAQARNCAVITSDISPMKEVAGESALLVNPESESDIREALLKLINKPEMREELIKKGKENIKKYSVESVAKQYIDLYKKILQQK